MAKIIEIDGSYGEGGGQILRSALSLSLITGKAFQIRNIRANRKNPGLAHQHLMAIHAAQQISQSQAEGDSLESKDLAFFPGKTKPGKYLFSVPTAGCMPLVLHTVYLPLAMAEDRSSLIFEGGTHVPWSPCYDYLEHIWAKEMENAGISISLKIHKAGYYPRGKGHFEAEVFPSKEIQPCIKKQRSPLTKLHLYCIISGLPEHVAQREIGKIQHGMKELGLEDFLETTILCYPALDSGNVLFLAVHFQESVAGFTALGERGKPAEKVAQELLKSFRDFWQTQSPLEERLGDQLLLPYSFAKQNSCYHVACITEHLLTNAYIINLFCDGKVSIQGETGKPGFVNIQS
ncbi:MAG: RNA 3'-phosphate cyclase [Candidatus Brocadiae bacterium]|nr:RNA 3'-phosphate cyclase [Candidatus Brocadiia bacterium]